MGSTYYNIKMRNAKYTKNLFLRLFLLNVCSDHALVGITEESAAVTVCVPESVTGEGQYTNLPVSMPLNGMYS